MTVQEKATTEKHSETYTYGGRLPTETEYHVACSIYQNMAGICNVVAMLDAIRAVNFIKETGWAPIMHAPKNGTVIDVLLRSGARIPNVIWDVPEFGEDETWISLDTLSPIIGPNEGEWILTHFCIPPKPPLNHPSKRSEGA